MLAVSDAVVIAAGGVLTAVVTGGLGLAGVVLNARRQLSPTEVAVDDSEYGRLAAQLVEVTADRDRWRSLALEWVPRRRVDDLADSPDGKDPRPDPQ